MKTNFLFPNFYKKIGWVLFIPGMIMGIIYIVLEPDPAFLKITVFSVADNQLFGDTSYFTFMENNIYDEITSILIILGALLIAFSKEKTEDEFIAKIRMESLVWATYINYFILIISIVIMYNMAFFWVLVVNMYTILLFFLIRFNWVLRRTRKQLNHEE